MKLNLGSGQCKLDGYVNVDIDPNVKPDLVHNFAEKALPYADDSIEEVAMIHTIEHIARAAHQMIFGEINRVLQKGGLLYVAFPNPEVIFKFFLENKRGMRAYWEATIVGRGNSIWDCHRAVMFVPDFVLFLKELGFGNIKAGSEVDQEHNIFLQAEKVFTVMERTKLLTKEINNAA